MNLTTPVTWPVRLLVIAVLTLAVFFFGWIKGAAKSQAELQKFTSEVKIVGVKQQAKIEATIEKSNDISKEMGEDYEKSSKRISALYGPGRVQHASSGGSKNASISDSTRRVDEGSANIGLGSGVRAPEPEDCKGLKADAAATTLQLLYLQAWILEQKYNWDSKLVESK